jgi:hypothetical protein
MKGGPLDCILIMTMEVMQLAGTSAARLLASRQSSSANSATLPMPWRSENWALERTSRFRLLKFVSLYARLPTVFIKSITISP